MEPNHRTLLRSIDTTTNAILDELRSMIVRQEEPQPKQDGQLTTLLMQLERGFTYFGWRVDYVQKRWIATNAAGTDTMRSIRLTDLLAAIDIKEDA